MSAKFPIAKPNTPGEMYTYSPGVEPPSYVKEAVITNKNFKETYKELLKTDVKSETDVYSTKVRVNEDGIIVETKDLVASDIPAHTHTSNEQGGLIQYNQKNYDLALTPSDSEYTVTSEIYSGIVGFYINGIFYTDFEKIEDSKIQLNFSIDQNCTANIVYY